MTAWSLAQARTQWGRSQGLDQRLRSPLAEAVAATGWIRSLGGAEAYLALAARVEGVTVAGVHEAVAAGDLAMAPAARGCMYLVPRADVPLAIAVARQLSERRYQRELDKVGVALSELDELGDKIVEALAGEARTTHGLRRALPEGAVRSLGEAGKKVGLSSTLPSALRRLEFAGRVVRRQEGHRLDHERYAWALAAALPRPEAAEAHCALAQRYVRWAAPATEAGFRAWSGLPARDAKAAMAAAAVVPVEVEGVGPAWVPTGLSPPQAALPSRVAFLPAMDNLFGLPASPEPLLDPAVADVPVLPFSRGGPVPLRQVNQPLVRTLARGGTVLGLWDYDPTTREVVMRAKLPLPSTGVEEELARVEALLGELGHSRAYSLDSDAKVARRVDHVRGIS